MQGGRGGRHGLFGFGDPFAGFGGFGFGRPGNMMPSFFGGPNPFDDPFFTNPFGTMMQPSLLGPSMFGPQGSFNGGMNNAGMFGSIMFGPQADLNRGMTNSSGFIQQAPEPSRPKGPIIKELSSDDEDDASGDKEDDKNEGNLRKHPRTSKGPYVEDPDDEAEGTEITSQLLHLSETIDVSPGELLRIVIIVCHNESRFADEWRVLMYSSFADSKRPKHGHIGREFSRASTSHPQPQTFMFQSSTVTYGGPNGACHTASTTRRTGRDGITLEEHKEADTTTGKATHQISRGIGNKGHSLTRKLNSDGHVNTLQTLHNLNEDELGGFEDTWQRNTGGNFPGWDPRINMLGSGSARRDIRDVNQMSALPAPDQFCGSNSSRNTWNGPSKGRPRRT
ncbi:hypothetical protein EJB05_10080 [Eragrostis curvula]|uniref:Uncharacterized protein n=1 Tax=Eragrostis curvula TaxID=38414 RepID=A0A5J9SP67_9POAL|nr:hypothetical protein EJB05_53837 [Eragrostis curvula]TVU43597.1 hypothetical protein EJB05_10080 [Eragrostis curvula]